MNGDSYSSRGKNHTFVLRFDCSTLTIYALQTLGGDEIIRFAFHQVLRSFPLPRVLTFLSREEATEMTAESAIGTAIAGARDPHRDEATDERAM